MPFNAHSVFRVVQDVDSYAKFIKFMTESKVDNSSRYEKTENKVTKGGFNASTTIGFQIVSFSYLSQVSYYHPKLPILRRCLDSEWMVSANSPESTIFNRLESTWHIKPATVNSCVVDYKISMEFSSPLYSKITS